MFLGKSRCKENSWNGQICSSELLLITCPLPACLLQLDVFEAAERYQKEGTPLIILAGKDYGSGNSRDWVAKGPYLLVNCSTHSAL